MLNTLTQNEKFTLLYWDLQCMKYKHQHIQMREVELNHL